MEAALGLLRRMPPKQSETALSALLSLIPQHSSDLLSQVDLPLQVLRDIESGKDFILCEYNRDADSYRYFFALFHCVERKFKILDRFGLG
jgi:capping protein beta